MNRFKQVVLTACAAMMGFVAACGDGPVAGADGLPGLHVVAGATAADTIEANLTQALVAEVRNNEGKATPGLIVRFESRPSDDTTRKDRTSYLCKLTVTACGSEFSFTPLTLVDTTDANGRAKALVRLGRVAGRVLVRVTVDGSSLVDSAVYTVAPGAATRVGSATADTILNVGSTATLRGRVLDRWNNVRAEAVTHTISAGSAATLDAATAVVTGQMIGTQTVYVRYNNFLDSTVVSVAPAARLVAYAFNAAQVRMVNSNGSNVRLLVSSVASALGVFPRFDQTRQRITLQTDKLGLYSAIVLDTTGTPRRDFTGMGFVTIMTERLLPDGNLLLVANRTGTPGFVVWRVAPDNTVTFVVAPVGLKQIIGGADFSPDGSKLAYESLTMAPEDLRIHDFATGTFTILAVGGTSPRYSPSGDRIAYRVGKGLGIINVDGTGRRVLGNAVYLAGISWSPDALYVIGRNEPGGLRMVRVSDGADVVLRFKNATGTYEEYIQPDWR